MSSDSSLASLKNIMPVKDLPERSCGRCIYAQAVAQIGGQVDFSVRECHGDVPKVQYFLIPPKKQGETPGIMEHSGWPKVESKAPACRHFSTRKDSE